LYSLVAAAYSVGVVLNLLSLNDGAQALIATKATSTAHVPRTVRDQLGSCITGRLPGKVNPVRIDATTARSFRAVMPQGGKPVR
jgi:hypothetical protein